MTPHWYPVVVLAPLAGLAIYCISQIAIARFVAGRGPYHSLSIGCACGLAVVLGIAGFATSRMSITAIDRISYVALDLLTYLALAFGYFNFVNLTVASLRIRLLEELQEAGGRLPMSTLSRNYNSHEVVAMRLDRLVRGGHLVEKDSRLHIGRLPFLMVARIFDGCHWLIIGNRKKSKA